MKKRNRNGADEDEDGDGDAEYYGADGSHPRPDHQRMTHIQCSPNPLLIRNIRNSKKKKKLNRKNWGSFFGDFPSF